jgi:hypothetical protein
MTWLFRLAAAMLLPVNRRARGSRLRLVGSVFLPGDLTAEGTLVGGISGIDHDPATGRWLLATDDRSTDAPARFYTASLELAGGRVGGVHVSGVVTLRRFDGEPYPTHGSPGRVPDIESIRVDPRRGEVWYITEGDGPKGLAPLLAVATPEGLFSRSIPLPRMFDLTPERTTGPRHNQAFEALAFAPDGSFWICLEGPMYEDGEPPAKSHGAPVRLTNLDRTGQVLRQVVYDLEPMRRAGRRFELAGVSEILAITDDRLLVIEREATIGVVPFPRFSVRIFEIDVGDASDVQHVDSLRGAAYGAVSKRLLLDMTWRNAGIVANVEGMAFGPALANGNRTLMLVTDNNQIPLLPTQVSVFEFRDPDLLADGPERPGRLT